MKKKRTLVSPPTPKVFEVIHELTHRAAAAWAVWFDIHVQQEGGGPFAMVLEIHRPFFNVISDAQIHFTILILSDLFGKRQGVHSYEFLIDRCLKEGRITPKEALIYGEKLRSLAKAQRGIGILRGKYFGHKLLEIPISEVFQAAQLKIKDIDEVFKVSFWLLGRLAFACGHTNFRGSADHELYARKSLDQIFNYFLTKWNNIGSGSSRNKVRTESR